MPLQTQNLVMVGLGVLDDRPPNKVQPRLVNGIHLRWAFKREHGFPWYGYYLFRRHHREGIPLCLARTAGALPPLGTPLGTSVGIPFGRISSDRNLLLCDDFPPAGQAEFDLEGEGPLRFDSLPGEPLRQIEVRVGFRAAASIRIVALLGEPPREAPVAQTEALGNAGDIVTVRLEFDAITAIEVGPGPAALIDFCVVRVSQDAAEGWKLMPEFPYPMALPVIHPDYPCQPQPEDVATSISQGLDRVRYGDPADFAHSTPLYDAGTVSVTSGSPVVTGAGTHWTEQVLGASFRVSGDLCSFTIVQVIGPEQLVLSRRYGNPTRSGAAYQIVRSECGQLYDFLVHLVAGGAAAGRMVDRSIPAPAHTMGTIDLTGNSATVHGNGTQWFPELAGLSLHAVGTTAGTVTVASGSTEVLGSGTNWTTALGGMALCLAGDRESYAIRRVHSPTKLILDRPYAQATASGKSYAIVERTSYAILRVDSPTQLTLNRAYAGPGGTGRAYVISATLQTAASGPRMPAQYPLDLVLLGSLNPALAQIVGLYWVDQTAEPDQDYDYLILADHSGRFDCDPARALALLREIGFGPIDGYIVFNKRMAPAPPLPPPDDVRVYALPGTVVRTQDGGIQDASNNAGVCWDRGVVNVGVQVLLPGRPVMHHLWRAALGDATPPAPPPPDRYRLLTEREPILVTRPRLPLGSVPQRPPGWPPFPLHAIDPGLPEGWYSYQVSGVDIFGRHSANSDAAAWHHNQGSPGDAPIHNFAVHLLDKIPPPPPTAIEAYALDPADPTVVKDAAFNAWWAALTAAPWYGALPASEKSNLIGLRLRWQWTEAHMRQASDVHEFRVYYQPGRLNALPGRTAAVSPAGSHESYVTTDIPNTRPADAFKDAWLHIGSDSFRIVSNDAASPLRLRVKNLGSSYHAGTVAVGNQSAAVIGTGTSWDAGAIGLHFQVSGDPAAYTVLAVTSLTQLTLDRPYTGAASSGNAYLIFDLRPRENAPCTVTIPPGHPLFMDYSQAANWNGRYCVVGYNEHAAPMIDTDGRPLRQYELFLPDPAVPPHDGLPLATSLADPIAYAHIGVSAADDKTHTADHPKWAAGLWGGRTGNEGPVGPPVTVFRVRREAPPPPIPPPDSEKVFATPADYHGHSYYTYRWHPAAAGPLRCHILRALDDAVFKADWARRPRPALTPAQLQFFPDPATDPRWDALKRQQVAGELNQLNAFKHDDPAGAAQAMAYYRKLCNDSLRILAALPGNDTAFIQLTIQPLDPADPANANRIGPDNPPDFAIDPALRAYIDVLDGRSTNRYFYRSVFIDGANNRSALSLSSPPVWLPNVVPPRAPVITKVLGGERQITLYWASNREPDLAEYRVYRATDASRSRDTTLMDLVQTIAVPADAVPPPEAIWADDTVRGLVTYTYRLVAVDIAGNASAPSIAVAARAFDMAVPEPPNLTVTWVEKNGVTRAEIQWQSSDHVLLQRRDPGGIWIDLAQWRPPGQVLIRDPFSEPGKTYEYRVRVQKYTGATALGPAVTLAAR